MKSRVVMVLAAFAGTILCTAAVAAPTCDAVRAAITRGSGDLKADFVRPLVVGRVAEGFEQFDLVSQAKIDGILKCKADRFVSFEAKIARPSNAGLNAQFAKAQEAALIAVLGWTEAHAQEKVRGMAADAADYLRGSQERGDVAVAGKVEEHEPGSIDLGVIWTKSDRSFIVLVSE